MMKRFLISATCWAVVIGFVSHGWAMPADPAGIPASAIQTSSCPSQSSQMTADSALAHFAIGTKGCIDHAHSASGGCMIDAVASSLPFDMPNRTWRIDGWIDAGSVLVSAILPPASPPPIPMF